MLNNKKQDSKPIFFVCLSSCLFYLSNLLHT